MDYITVIIAILFGVLSGVGAGLLGYMKTVIPMVRKGLKVESLDYKKLSQTIVLGAIIGAYAGYKGISLELAEPLFFDLVKMAGVTVIFDWVMKVVVRSLTKGFSFSAKPKKTVKSKHKTRKKVKDEEE